MSFDAKLPVPCSKCRPCHSVWVQYPRNNCARWPQDHSWLDWDPGHHGERCKACIWNVYKSNAGVLFCAQFHCILIADGSIPFCYCIDLSPVLHANVRYLLYICLCLYCRMGNSTRNCQFSYPTGNYMFSTKLPRWVFYHTTTVSFPSHKLQNLCLEIVTGLDFFCQLST